MASEYDSSAFIYSDITTQKSPFAASTSGANPLRAPSRDDVDRKVVEAQQKLVELKRAQEELERERAGLEELRRRQSEFQTGRQEIVQQLTRGLGLLEEAEFCARRDAEQMVKTVGDFRAALAKVQAIHDEIWTKENFQIELTRALTTIENARMEWNSAGVSTAPSLAELSFIQLCKIGLAMTWPLLLVALAALGILIVVLARH